MNNTHSHFFKFLVAGVSVVIFNVGFLYLLTHLFHLWYLVSSVISYALAVLFNFILQKFWVFDGSRNNATRRQFYLYVLVSVVYLLLNTLGMYILVDRLEVYYLVSQVFLTFALSIANFFVNRNFIFTYE